jgi:hypothetical protein
MLTVNSLKKLKVHRLTIHGPACNPPTTHVCVVAFDDRDVTCKGCLKGHGKLRQSAVRKKGSK